MATIDTLRNSIIDKLLTISNKDYLSALNQLIDKNSTSDKTFHLSAEQISILQLSEEDIANNDLISHEKLNKEDLRWLEEL
jgi:hypothetical protein